MDREAWQATVHGVAKSQTRLNNNTPCPWNLTGICATSGLIQILLVKVCFVANDKKKKT